MTGPGEETDIAHLAIAPMHAAEAVLLHVGNALHDEADGEQYNTSDVASGSKTRLTKLCDFGRVQDSDW